MTLSKPPQDEKTEKLSGDELVARVRAEMGFLVMPSFVECEIGKVVKIDATSGLKCNIPFVVVAKSTKKQNMRQRRHVSKIAPYADVALKTSATHFYLIEAAD